MPIQTNTAKINNAGITVAYTDNSGAAVTQNITFANKTTSLDSGLNVTAGAAALSGALAVTGVSNLNNVLNVAGASHLNTLVVDGAAQAGSSFAANGAANLANVMNVAGATHMSSSLVADQAASLGSTLTVGGAAAMNSTLAVAGVTNLNNVVNVANTANMGAALNVANGATLNSTLDVIGASHMHDTLLVDGVMAQPTLTAYNGSVPLDNAHVTYNMYNVISGAITVPQDADGAQLLSLSFYGTGATNAGGWAKVYFNIPVPGMDGIWYGANYNQMVTFDFTFGGSSSYTLTGGQTINAYLSCLEGWRTFNAVRNPDGSLAMKITYKKAAGAGAAAVNLGSTMTIAGATVFNNNLTVNGTAALNGAITISGALGMGGSGNVAGAATMSSTLDAVGAAHLKNTLLVDGAASMGSSLAVANAANLGNVLNVAGASALHNTLLVDGAATMGSSLNVTGVSNLNNVLNVSGAAALGSTLGVSGAATVGGALAVTGASNLADVMNVTGAAALHNTLAADGAASIGGALAVTGAANMNAPMNVAGAAALNATLAVAGAASLNNTLGVVGAATMGSSLNVAGVSNVNSTLAVTGATTFQNNVTVNGNMTVLGSQTAIDTVSLQVKDNAVLIGDGNVADTLESGLMMQYKPSGAANPKYAGVKRRPATSNGGGEFVFFKDADSQISETASSGSSGSAAQTINVTWSAEAGNTNNFVINSATPSNKIVAKTQQVQAYALSAGSYTYSATAVSRSNDVVTITMIDDANTVIATITNSMPPWSSTMGPFTGSFTLNALTNVRMKFDNNYYMDNANVAITYTFTPSSAPSTQNYTLEWRTPGNNTLPMKASTTVPSTGIIATGRIHAYTLPAGSYTYTATIVNDSNDWCDVNIVNNATNAVISTIVTGANDPPWGQRGPFSRSFVLSAQTDISIRYNNDYYVYGTGVYMTLVGTALPVTSTTQNYNLEWRSIGNGTLPMKASTTTPSAGINATGSIQSYSLPAGSYTYTATIENDSNDWCDVNIVDNSNESIISIIVTGANDPPWGQRGPFSRSFVLTAPKNISIRFSNGYYMYSTGVSMTVVGTFAGPAEPVYTDVYAAVLADSFKCASDRTLKKNIVTLDGALEKLDDIKGVYHGWIQKQEHDKREVGVIAQDVQKVYPELVAKCGNGYLSVNYPKLTAVLLQSVKELKAKVLEIAAKRKQ